MTRRLATQATALGLAVIATLTLMTGIHQLAAPADAHQALAGAAQAPVQVVVVTGKRMPRG